MINITWQEANQNGIYFKTNGKRCIITKYKGNDNYVVIPDFIDNKPVKAIDKKAFKNSHIQNVLIPDSVLSIGKDAFYNTDIKSVVLPRNIRLIKSRAFAECKNLNSVVCMNRNFYNSVQLENSVFYNTPYINQEGMVILNGILLKYNEPGSKFNKPKQLFIPSDVKVIESYAFFRAYSLEKILFPYNHGIKLKKHAFFACTKLNELVYYNDINNIFRDILFISSPADITSKIIFCEKDAFANCSILKNTLENNIKERKKGFNIINCAVSDNGYYGSPKLRNIFVPCWEYSSVFDIELNTSGNSIKLNLVLDMEKYDERFKHNTLSRKIIYSFYIIDLSLDRNKIKYYMDFLQQNIRYAIRILVTDDNVEFMQKLNEWNILKEKHIKYALKKAEDNHAEKCTEFLKSLNK